jgi:plastocyanin
MTQRTSKPRGAPYYYPMDATSRPNVPTWALALIVPVLAVIAVIVTLNATSDDTGHGASASAGTANAVVIKDFAFAPATLRVSAGAAVAVTNDDGAAHTLTADDGKFDTGRLDGGKQATITIDEPGTYAYHCDIHNYMTGVIEAS